MGVDIYAYSKIRPTKLDGDDDYFIAYVHPDFPDRAVGIIDGTMYTFEISFEIYSGNSRGFCRWRNALAKLAGYARTPDTERPEYESYATTAWNATSGPFWELINFADNEGVISGTVITKLANDFAEYQAKADAVGGWIADYYALFRQGFELATDEGAISFH